MTKNKSITIIVPALNEEKNLANTLNKILRQKDRWGKLNILIYNDGSTDRTGEIADQYSRKYRFITVIHHHLPQNLGNIFKHAVLNIDSDYTMVIHGQDAITDKALEDIFSNLSKDIDIIIPYQKNFNQRQLHRRIISKTFTTCLNLIFNRKIKYYNHYVLIRTALLKSIKIKSQGYTYQAEIILKLLNIGARFIEIPVIDNFASKTATKIFSKKNFSEFFLFFMRMIPYMYRLRFTEDITYLERRLETNATTLNAFPGYVHIETINNCNAECIMCGIDFKAKIKQLMSMELYKKIIDEIALHKNQVKKVMLYLDGEPLLDKFLTERIKYAKDSGISLVNIATNGSLLTPELSKDILIAGLDEIYIAIDSLDKTIYEKIRKKLNFDKVFQNISHFIKIRNELKCSTKIRIQFIKQELNFNEADSFLEYWKNELTEQDEIAIQSPHNWAGKVDVLKVGDEQKTIEQPCIALWGTLVIHSNGKVPLCCMDTKNQIPLGDTNFSSINEIWHSKELAQQRKIHLNANRSEHDLCSSCTLWRENKRSIHK